MDERKNNELNQEPLSEMAVDNQLPLRIKSCHLECVVQIVHYYLKDHSCRLFISLLLFWKCDAKCTVSKTLNRKHNYRICLCFVSYVGLNIFRVHFLFIFSIQSTQSIIGIEKLNKTLISKKIKC